jgi:hypothetical protein
VRIAEAVYNTAAGSASAKETSSAKTNSYATNYFDEMQMGSSTETLVATDGEGVSSEERKVLERVAEDLARLGRIKRVGLGIKEKTEFLRQWRKTRKIW